MKINDAHPGDAVIYRPHPGAPAEDGNITAVNGTYVFVRFVGDRQSKACRPEDLQPAHTRRHGWDPDAGDWAGLDEHGYDLTPGQDPTYVGLS